ncbi:5-hydroxyisourate hydrolase, partial [Burkholderia multivorans]
MGKLTTHVLDTANGRPGAALKVDLYALDGDSRRTIKTVLTNSDGRCDEPLLEGAALTAGEYELVFHAGDYFASLGVKVP